MAGPKQSKRVSWAPGVNLCQVRLFLSEDAPTQSALGSQDHLQAKAAWLLHSSGAISDDSVPPGFENPHRGQIQRNIPSIKWQCPPNQMLKPEWLVVAGEESQEVALQNKRQLGILEAVYPRLSLIPPDPSVSPEVQLVHIDDTKTPLIPIIAKEDEDASEQDSPPQIISSHFIPPTTTPPESLLPSIKPSIPSLTQAQPKLPEVVSPKPGTSAEPDIAAAALAAFTAIMRSNEKGSLIDRDLLIKILCDPSMLEKLASEQATPKQAPLPTLPPPSVAITNSAYPPPILSPITAPNLEFLPLRSLSIPITPTAVPSAKSPPAKDLNYYKSLIQKHGGDRQEPTEPVPLRYETSHAYHSNPLRSIYGEVARHEQGQSESRRPKIAKPCAYFNTPRGCRLGGSCSYLHDSSMPKSSYLHDSSTSEKIKQQRGAKRFKFDR